MKFMPFIVLLILNAVGEFNLPDPEATLAVITVGEMARTILFLGSLLLMFVPDKK